MKKLLLIALLGLSGAAAADRYVVDTKGAHAFVQFKISHLGFSWLYGRFDSFSGEFNFDENDPSAARIQMTVDTNSVNSNHTARDKHLRSDDFLNVAAHPTATFVSKSFSPASDGHGTMTGDLTLNGVTQEIELDVKFIGAGKDPWGGERRGYEATTELSLSDFKLKKSVDGAYEQLWLTVSVEGIKQ
ncbi:YceI family protein [Marinicella meishanensis]|uniref:YceI family protein n=1 Tax=Marinicella meishanensis TaxID=2873263 RepID=UPI001CBB7D99|nr:YceI family protein [Marinicella sp. NBU2979]